MLILFGGADRAKDFKWQLGWMCILQFQKETPFDNLAGGTLFALCTNNINHPLKCLYISFVSLLNWTPSNGETTSDFKHFVTKIRVWNFLPFSILFAINSELFFFNPNKFSSYKYEYLKKWPEKIIFWSFQIFSWNLECFYEEPSDEPDLCEICTKTVDWLQSKSKVLSAFHFTNTHMPEMRVWLDVQLADCMRARLNWNR